MRPTEFFALRPSSRDFFLQYETMAEAWEACDRPEWLFWILEREGLLTKALCFRIAIAFAKRSSSFAAWRTVFFTFIAFHTAEAVDAVLTGFPGIMCADIREFVPNPFDQ